MTTPWLHIAGLHVAYGGASALTDVSLAIHPGEIVALLGANGAGKSSLLRAVMGLVPARSRHLTFAGTDLSSLAPEHRARQGIAYVPEGRRVFPGMTVEENIKVATRSISYATALTQSFNLFPQLAEHHRRTAWRLSGGQQQMLAIARALVSQPRLILLDEPSLGLAPGTADDVFTALTEISRQGAAILLAEQSAARALHVAGRGYILQRGRIIASDNAAALARHMTLGSII